MNLEITEYKSRTDRAGIVRELTWEDLKDRLRHPKFTLDDITMYLAMTNEERTKIKDVGGFVGGRMDGTRSKTALINRTVLTIDQDHAEPGGVEQFMAGNNVVFCCHTTHTSTKDQPRLRWVFPLSRPVTSEEYRAIAGEVCSWVGPGVDDSTDQPERLMFWPSCSFDADFSFWEGGDAVLDPDEILDKADPIPQTPAPQKDKTPDVGEELTVIPEGQRNKTVFGFAASLRKKGLDQDSIRAMVAVYNDRYCSPPLPDDELDTICQSACRYEAGSLLNPAFRSADDDFADLGPIVKREPKETGGIVVESAASLNARYIPPPKFVVPDIIPCGLTILASPPKFGKSWMCLDMAISVATGTPFMGLETNKDGVIYLALEDGDYRLQERSKKVANGRELPENLLLSTQAPTLPDGLLPKLGALVDTCQVDPSLLIIDTLQKIRGTAAKTEGAYGYDYREIGQLHQFALDRNLALVIVHHLNKRGDDNDFVSRLNGTTGVAGAADSIITLTRASRGSEETKMSITGRDIKDRTLLIKMDWSKYRWILLGDEKDVERERESIEFKADPIVKTILWKLAKAEDKARADAEHDWPEAEWCCTSQELRDEVKSLYGQEYDSAAAVGKKLQKLIPLLEAKEGISCEYRRIGKNRDRTHRFTRAIE